MKVLLVLHQFFPDFSAGTEVLTYGVARELIRQGHEVYIFTGFPGKKELPDEDRFDAYSFDGIQIYRFHHAYTPMGGQTTLLSLDYDNRLAASYFAKVLADIKPDVVHFFHMFRLGSGLVDKAAEMGIPSFMTVTDFWAICPTIQLLLPDSSVCNGPHGQSGNCIKHFGMIQFPRLAKSLMSTIPDTGFDFLARISIRWPLVPEKYRRELEAIGARVHTNVSRLNQLQKIIVSTSIMRETLLRFNVKPERVVQLAFGVNFEVVSNRVKSPGLLKIGFIGGLVQHKGCHLLIEAFKELPAGCASLAIYGDEQGYPEYAKQLKLMANGDHLIQFRGVFDNCEISTVLAGFDVLVVPSLWQENSPLVVLSAHACRCPVIASDLAGLSETVQHDKNGLLFEAGNKAALARQLFRLIDDTSLIDRLSAQIVTPKSTKYYAEELVQIWTQKKQIA